MKEPASGHRRSCSPGSTWRMGIGEVVPTTTACVPESTPGIGPETRDRLSLTVRLPRSACRSSSSCSPDNKNNTPPAHKGTPTLQQLERKVQRQVEIEDKRVRELAEGILYEFLPAAFDAVIPPCGDPRTELTHERCKVEGGMSSLTEYLTRRVCEMVASAALSVGALMNTPPRFLEFLLRIPWQKVEHLHSNASCPEWIEEQLEVPECLRQELVNTPIHPTVLPSVLEFLFSSSYRDSVPLQLKSNADPVPQYHLDEITALLDGASPLHCAAIRGNPAQIDHLLSSGADPFVKTVPGDLPIQLIPFCGDRCTRSGGRICRCMTKKDQEIWECRSIGARSLLARKCVLQFGRGLLQWAIMTILCLLNILGLWGCFPQITRRKAILNHVQHQQQIKLTQAYLESKRLLCELRQHARQGKQCLLDARQAPRSPSTGEENGYDGRRMEDTIAEKAFLSYVNAVHFLQNLLQHNDGISPDTMPVPRPIVTATECQVPEDEQSDVYCCWAESALLKFKSCRCTGCAAVAVQAIRMAHVQCAQLLALLEKATKNRRCGRWRSIGSNLMHIVYFHICLLLDTEARQSPTKASMWRAEQCVKEYRRLTEKGLSLTASDGVRVGLLDRWVCSAESDLMLAEALYGDLMTPSQTVNDILKQMVTKSSGGMRYHLLPSSLENVNRLEAALNKSKAPTSDLAALTVEIMQNGKREIRAAEDLKECLAMKTPSVVTGRIEKLAEAISEAENFPRLAVDVDAAQQIHQQLLKRAEAIERLEVIMLQSKQPISPKQDAAACQDVYGALLKERITSLQIGIEQGKKARINTEKARKQLRELQLQMSVVESAQQIDALMTKKHCGSAAIRAVLTKAENCYSGASGHISNGLISLSAFLLPRIQNARKRLEIERVMESLSRATTTCTTVDDLSKLESIILDARKVLDEMGSEELDHKGYREARILRGKLHTAAKIRQQLQSGVKSLQRQQRKIDAMALEQILQQAVACKALVEVDVSKAEQALEHWRCLQQREEHLNKVMNEVEDSAELSKAIQEAASAGVKTQSAKKILRMMQTLEITMQQINSRTTSKPGHLRTVIEDAEKGGVSPKLIGKARALLRNLYAVQATELLLGSMRGDAGRDFSGRCERLRHALKDSSSIIECSAESSVTGMDEIESTEFDSRLRKMESESSEEFRPFFEAVRMVRTEILRCETEIERIKRCEEEKRVQEIEKERKEKERREMERTLKEQKFLEEKTTNSEKTKPTPKSPVASDRRPEKEKQDSAELHKNSRKPSGTGQGKTVKEKRTGVYRRPLVDPVTQRAVVESQQSPVSSQVQESPAQDESFLEMEYEVQRILSDDTQKPSLVRSPSDSNRHVRGVLDALVDPWETQSSDPPPLMSVPRPAFLRQPLQAAISMAPEQLMGIPPTTDPFELLLLKKRANDAMRIRQLREAGDVRFTMQPPTIPSYLQPRMPGLSWAPSPVGSLHSHRSVPLDSSAPAFYPTHSLGSQDFSSMSPNGPRGQSPGLDSQWLSSSLELPRSVEGPFPGVGAGIPGAPSRSLSERIDCSQLPRTLSDRE